MTNEEAINVFKGFKFTPREMKAVAMGIEALEKQMPKKANIDIGYDTEGNAWNNWRCPCCRKNYLLDDEEYNYCPQCGQKIDWSEWK